MTTLKKTHAILVLFIGSMLATPVALSQDARIKIDTDRTIGEFSGQFEVFEVNRPDIKTTNGFTGEPVKTEQKPNIRVNGDRFRYSFPAHSFTQLIGRIDTD